MMYLLSLLILSSPSYAVTVKPSQDLIDRFVVKEPNYREPKIKFVVFQDGEAKYIGTKPWGILAERAIYARDVSRPIEEFNYGAIDHRKPHCVLAIDYQSWAFVPELRGETLDAAPWSAKMTSKILVHSVLNVTGYRKVLIKLDPRKASPGIQRNFIECRSEIIQPRFDYPYYRLSPAEQERFILRGLSHDLPERDMSLNEIKKIFGSWLEELSP